jgi:hypothetical protein
MEPQIRLVHWYDTERHRIACGAAGQSNSSKHGRTVTCTACLTVASQRGGAAHAHEDGATHVH